MWVPVPPHLLVCVWQHHQIPHSVDLNSECHSFNSEQCEWFFFSFLFFLLTVRWSVHEVGVSHLWSVWCVILLVSYSSCSGLCDLWNWNLFILMGKRQGRFQVKHLTKWIVLSCLFLEEKSPVFHPVSCWVPDTAKSHGFINVLLSIFGTVNDYVVIWGHRRCWPVTLGICSHR